jgi:hypothetical protein
MVANPTRTIKEKLFLMPGVALTEETGIILARHLKSYKRRTPPQTPFLSNHRPMAVKRLFVLGVFATPLRIHVSKNRARTHILVLISIIYLKNTYLSILKDRYFMSQGVSIVW